MTAKQQQEALAALTAQVSALTALMGKPESKPESKPETAKPATIGYFNVRTCERLKIASKVNATFTYEGKGGSVSDWRVLEVPKCGGVLATRV